MDSLEGMDVLAVVLDATGIVQLDRDIIGKMSGVKAPRILILNKADLVEEAALLRAIQMVSGFGFDEIVPVSARTGWNLEDLRKTLVSRLPQGPMYFPEDMITDQPERIICAEIIREKALKNLRDEVPHGIGVEMMSFAQAGDSLTEIHATLYCEKQSHKSIIIGKGGSMLRTIGTEARGDIERLLGTRVNLQLWVKVRENWRDRKGDLRTLGYEV